VKARGHSHQSVAWCYDEIAEFYSRGAIREAKFWSVDHFAPGERVLFAGVGRGEEALRALGRGVDVSGIDLSTAMLARLRRSLEGAGHDATLIHGDFFEHHDPEGYDAVAAHFVLNVFAPDEMRLALSHLASLVKPGGLLAIADFAPAPIEARKRWLYAAHYRPINIAARCLGLCRLHPLYDYEAELTHSKWGVKASRGFGPFAAGPDFYRSLLAVRR